MLRVIKYLGFDSHGLSAQEIDVILRLYPDFEDDPELVVGIGAVARLTELDPDRLSELLGKHRHELPYLGTTAHPMVPRVAIDMIRAVAAGEDPLAAPDEKLYTLTEMAERTQISLATLSKYVKEQPERVPSRLVGKMRKFPHDAIGVFQRIKVENLSRRGNGRDRVERQKAALSKRYAAKFAELEEQLDAALDVSNDLSRALKRLTRQVRRARAAADTGAKPADAPAASRARRSGGHRPHTIVAACKTVLAGASEPMRVADITARVIAMGTPIKAKNPNVTISSILSSYRDFGRVRRGYYQLLRSEAPEAGNDAVGPAAGAVAAPAAIDQDPGDVLAGLRAAADA